MIVVPCSEFEERLLAYDDLAAEERQHTDAHVRQCERCDVYLTLLRQIDAELSDRLGHLRMNSHLMQRAQARAYATTPISRPSAWPEVLDFLGLTAVVILAVGVIWTVVPVDMPTLNRVLSDTRVLLGLATLATGAAIAISWKKSAGVQLS